MTLPKSLAGFTDVKLQLEELRSANGGLVEFDTYGQAVAWMAKVYTYRSRLRAQAQAEFPVPGFEASTPWDDLLMKHDKTNRSRTVEVRFGVLKKGKIKPLPGAVRRDQDVEIPVPVVEETDDLMIAALNLVKDQGEKE